VPECFHLLTAPLHHLSIWLVESNEARMWRHHHPELVEFVATVILFDEGHCPVNQTVIHTETGGMNNIGCDNSPRRDAVQLLEDPF